jgi:hypothetical protein
LSQLTFAGSCSLASNKLSSSKGSNKAWPMWWCFSTILCLGNPYDRGMIAQYYYIHLCVNARSGEYLSNPFSWSVLLSAMCSESSNILHSLAWVITWEICLCYPTCRGASITSLLVISPAMRLGANLCCLLVNSYSH